MASRTVSISGRVAVLGADVIKNAESSEAVPGRPVYDDGVLRITEVGSPAGLAIAGEIDDDTYGALVETLDGLTRGVAEIHVNLAGVEYCDLAGLRAIILLARADRDGLRRRVVLHEVPPQLQAVLRIVGWNTTPGLVIE